MVLMISQLYQCKTEKNLKYTNPNPDKTFFFDVFLRATLSWSFRAKYMPIPTVCKWMDKSLFQATTKLLACLTGSIIIDVT